MKATNQMTVTAPVEGVVGRAGTPYRLWYVRPKRRELSPTFDGRHVEPASAPMPWSGTWNVEGRIRGGCYGLVGISVHLPQAQRGSVAAVAQGSEALVGQVSFLPLCFTTCS